MIATLKFDNKKRRLTPDEVREMRTDLAEHDWQPIVLTFEHIGETHLTAGRIREALAEFRRLNALHPQEALHVTQIARALLEGGMGERARQEARRAIDLEPASAVAHRTLGWVLQHDTVGRRFKKGWDLEGDVGAYRKALELDSSSFESRGDLAILLEHDAEGTRYGSEAKLDEAIAEYELLQDELDASNPLYNNLPVALMWERRFDELEKFLRSYELSAERTPLLLVAIAAMRGPEAAVVEVRRIHPHEESRQAALLNAGQLLVQLRLYPQAAALQDAAAKGHSNAAAVLAQAEMIRKTQRHEELSLPEDDPRTVVKRLFINLFLGATVDEFLSLFSDDLRNSQKDDLADMQKVQRFLRSRFQKAGVPVEVVVDLALSVSQMAIDGDDSLGYRIRLQTVTAGQSADEIYYVTLDGESYRVVTTGRTSGEMGNEILKRSERGDLVGARHWLDWARQGQSLSNGDDPIGGRPFLRFWPKGSNSGLEDIRYAAASLIAETASAERAIPILQEGRENSESEGDRVNFDLALALAFARLDRQEEVLTVARRLFEARPDSLTAFHQVAMALRKLEHWDDLKKLVEDRLRRLHNDPDALRILSELAHFHEGDFQKAREFHNTLVELGEANAMDFNNQAWRTLFYDSVTDEGIELAQRSVLLTQSQDAASLHTLSALYAEVGKTTEAREVLLQSMETGASEEPESDDWYVLGRIAEQYGELEAAVAAYGKVDSPGQETSDSTYVLAQRRLAALRSRFDEGKR